MIHGGAVPGIAGVDKVFALMNGGGKEKYASSPKVRTSSSTKAEVKEEIERLKRNQKSMHYRLHVYESRGEVYKITLVFAGKGRREMEERKIQAQGKGNLEVFYQQLKEYLGIGFASSLWYEDGCLQILASGVCKLSGVQYICAKAGFAREDVVAYGDGETDVQMMEYYNENFGGYTG